MRNISKRSFTVEVRSADRTRSAGFLPTRIIKAVATSWRPIDIPAAPVVPEAHKKRRILPTILKPEPFREEPAPIDETPVKAPRARRAASSKPKVTATAVVEQILVPMAIETPEPIASVPVTSVRRRSVTSRDELPRGQRWKVRLRRAGR